MTLPSKNEAPTNCRCTPGGPETAFGVQYNLTMQQSLARHTCTKTAMYPMSRHLWASKHLL